MDSASTLASILQPGQLVVLESTTYPGTTRERLAPGARGVRPRSPARDFHVAFSPERVDPGRTDYTLRTTPKIIGGLTEACLDAAENLYALVCDEVVRVSSPEAAEMSKLLENIFRSVNIALVNELAELADRMGLDIHEVVDAAATKPFGFMRFDPGPGMGGHCLPVDPFYLTWKAREYDFVDRVHRARRQGQPARAVRLGREDRARAERPRAPGARIADRGPRRQLQGRRRRHPRVTGAEDRRPPAKLGADVVYHDRFVPACPSWASRASRSRTRSRARTSR